ncbi:asparagine synthase (glutamine-hydrolyzing) [bacterium]|nr:asparagine synthase (glutamine-hydrolyzing) [bacterium]
MCGFVTGVDPASLAPDVSAQLDLISHRGPDDRGVFSQDVGPLRVSLAHRRLSIIDLSLRGHQPMQSAPGGPVIVFNGEIYNFQELRGVLEAGGRRFRSKTDTEVLLAAYEEWGESCLDRLAGMWSFVIWDPRKNKLFGARDRFGIKPLYYYQDKDRFCAASEIKSLLAHPHVKTAPNSGRILDYFLFNLHDHTEQTMFKDILQVPPAHAFRLDLTGHRLTQWRYWSLPTAQENRADWGASVRQVREDLLRSVREHLVADVPVGFCLSGGIDSSSIVSLARALKQDSAPMVAFTSAYDDSPFDEREYAREVVKAKAMDWHVVIPGPDRMFEDLEKMIYFQDEPPVHSSVYAQWCVMRMAREKGVKVLLDGQGADELFAGYPAHRDVMASDLLLHGRWIRMLREGSSLPRAVYGLAPAGLKAALFRIRSPAWRALNADLRGDVEFQYLSRTFENLQYRDLKTRLDRDTFELHLPKLLHYEDRNSMAFSIESRVPFLDHRLAETACQTPVDWRLSARGSKWILREAMREFVPARVLDRKDKIGFETPQTAWLKKLLERREELLLEGWAARNLSHPSLLRRLRQSGGESDFAAIWKIICLNQWHRIFFERPIG